MASLDDENTFTIETDSEGPIMPPTSSTLRMWIDGQRDNYLDFLPRMPMQLQIENMDAVIINAEKDMQHVRSFQNQILKTVRLTENGEQVQPKVKLICEIPGFKQNNINNLAIAFQKTNYIFLFATKSLFEADSILSRLETILMQKVNQKNIIPVNTKNKKCRDYNLGPMYSGVKSIEFWSTDQFFVKSVQNLFERKIGDRLKREKELESERKKHYFEVFGKLGQRMQGIELKEDSGLCDQNQSLQNSYPQTHQVKHLVKESISHPPIQIDGPTVPLPMPVPEQYPHAQPSSSPLVCGFSEIPQDHFIPISYTPHREIRQQRVPVSSFHHTSDLSSRQNTFSSSQTPTPSMEVQPPESHLHGHQRQYPQFVPVESVNSSGQPMVFYQPYLPLSYVPWDPSQFIRVSGGPQPSCTMLTSSGHTVQGGSQSQASYTSHSTSHTTSGLSFQFPPGNSVPQSSSTPSTQSGNVQIININIKKVGNASIGSNPTLITKTDISDEEDGDSDSSDSLSDQEKNPGLDMKRSEDTPVFMRSTGGNVSTAEGGIPPSSIRQPVSASYNPESRGLSYDQEPYSQSNTARTHVKYVTPQRDEAGSIITQETAVKQIFEDESELDDQTNRKRVF